MCSRRVVVTGIGFVGPLGCGSDAIWQRVLDGKSGIRNLTEIEVPVPITIAAQVPKGAQSDEFNESSVGNRNMSLFAKYALHAASIAIQHAKIPLNFESYNVNRIGVAIASGIGSLSDITAGSAALNKSPKQISPYFIPKILINMAASQVSLAYGLKGPTHAVATACAAGAHAIGDAYNFLRLGYADMMLAGGAEACIDPLAIVGFHRMKALSTNTDASTASRPFDVARDGFVMGEGAAVMVLETLHSAQQRGASIICEVAGYGVSSDAHHITTPSGEGAAAAMRSALFDAQLDASQLQYINAHATSTPVGDVAEAKAIESIFKHDLYVSSTKGATGHMLGAAGAIEAAFAALATRDDAIPATLNLTQSDYTPSFRHVQGVAVQTPVSYAMSNSFGFGGTNASLIFKKYLE